MPGRGNSVLISRLRQTIAVFLSLCVLAPSSHIAEAYEGVTAQPSPNELTLPASLGRIADSYNAPAKDAKRVILIQDLHANYGVQKNIAAILDHLSQRL